MEGQKSLTYASRTALLFDVSFVLVTEIAQGGENRVGSSLSQTAQGVLFYVVAELFQLIQILHGSGALGNLV